MAFALWIGRDLAWAEGLHEYRPMGVAIIAATDRFRPRDFRPGRRVPARAAGNYAGLYASLPALNRRLSRPMIRRSETPAWI